MDIIEDKTTNESEPVKHKSRRKIKKFDILKISPSTAIKISALIAAGLLSYSFPKQRESVQVKSLYTEEFQTIDTDNLSTTAASIENISHDIISKIDEDSFEKTHKYLIDSSNELIDELNKLNKIRFKQYFEEAGVDTNQYPIFSVRINSKQVDNVNPSNENKNSYYLICNSKYIQADNIDSVKLEADLRELVNENQTHSDQKHSNFKNNLKKYASEISMEKLSELTLLDNNGNLISINNAELEKRIEDKEKMEKNPIQNFLFGSNKAQKEHLQNIRKSKIKNLPKITNTEINDSNDTDLYQTIDSKNTEESEPER